MNLFIIGFVVLIVCGIISRFLGERALQELTPEEKVRLVDGFSKQRIWYSLPFLLLVVLLIVLLQSHLVRTRSLLIGFMALVVVMTVVHHFIVMRRLRSLDLPQTYQKRYAKSRMIVLLGFFIFIGFLFGMVMENRL